MADFAATAVYFVPKGSKHDYTSKLIFRSISF